MGNYLKERVDNELSRHLVRNLRTQVNQQEKLKNDVYKDLEELDFQRQREEFGLRQFEEGTSHGMSFNEN